MPYNTYGGYGGWEDAGDEFDLGLPKLPNFNLDTYNSAPTAPQQDKYSYDKYSQRLNDVTSKFDSEGRYGIDDHDRAKAKDSQWATIGAALAKLGATRGKAGGEIAATIGGAQSNADDAYLDSRSNKNLAVELAKLDLEKNLSAAQKDRLTMEKTMDELNTRENARQMFRAAVKEDFGPDQRALLLSGFDDPNDRKEAELKLHLFDLYVEAGDQEKAMALSEEIRSKLPAEKVQAMEDLQERNRRASEGTQEGKNNADAAYNERMLQGGTLGDNFEYGNDGKVKMLSPLELKQKKLGMAAVEQQIASSRDQMGNRKVDNDREAAKISGEQEKRITHVQDALNVVRSLERAGGKLEVDPATGQFKVVKKDGSPMILMGPAKDALGGTIRKALAAAQLLEDMDIGPSDPSFDKLTPVAIEAYMRRQFAQIK